jgi:hypothetical protein
LHAGTSAGLRSGQLLVNRASLLQVLLGRLLALANDLLELGRYMVLSRFELRQHVNMLQDLRPDVALVEFGALLLVENLFGHLQGLLTGLLLDLPDRVAALLAGLSFASFRPPLVLPSALGFVLGDLIRSRAVFAACGGRALGPGGGCAFGPGAGCAFGPGAGCAFGPGAGCAFGANSGASAAGARSGGGAFATEIIELAWRQERLELCQELSMALHHLLRELLDLRVLRLLRSELSQLDFAMISQRQHHCDRLIDALGDLALPPFALRADLRSGGSALPLLVGACAIGLRLIWLTFLRAQGAGRQ